MSEPNLIIYKTAELRAKNRIDITMVFWLSNVERILEGNDMPILTDQGAVSHKQMEEFARREYSEFDTRRKVYEAQQADEEELNELKELEELVKRERNG